MYNVLVETTLWNDEINTANTAHETRKVSLILQIDTRINNTV